jgi:hypothetical protein
LKKRVGHVTRRGLRKRGLRKRGLCMGRLLGQHVNLSLRFQNLPGESSGNLFHQTRLACLLSNGGSSSSSCGSGGDCGCTTHQCVAQNLRAHTSFTYDSLLVSVTVYRSERRSFPFLLANGSLLAANDFALRLT